MGSEIKRCVIYCRVSTPDQVANGGGIDSQETICRDHAKRQGWEVQAVFRDLGVSGKDIEGRPQINAMLDFLDSAKEPCVVLFYDISRLTRENCDFGLLRKIIESKGHRLSTIRGILDQTSIGRFMANIEAAQAQYFRESNAERNNAFSRECLKAGWWIYGVPPGYQHAKRSGEKRNYIVPKEPLAGIIKEALEGFAYARFVSQTDVLDFVNARLLDLGMKSKDLNYIKRILTSPFYTGFFSFPKWDIPAQTWKIEPFIDTDTFNLIQDRLAGRNRINHRRYNKHDERFPLKGFVVCPVCGRPLTASMTKGGTYPYYQCQNAKCTGKRLANVAPKVIHAEFEELLGKIAPTAPVLALTRALAKGIYQERHTAIYADRETKQRRIEAIGREQKAALDAFIKATTDATRAGCEERMTELDTEKARLINAIDAHAEELMPFDAAFGYVSDFVSRPLVIWQGGNLARKQLVLNLCFSDRISYNKEQRFGTPSLSPIFGLFEGISGNTSKVVPLVRIGLTTPSLPRMCSATEPQRHSAGL